jgi:hypothetical protein
MMLVLAGKPAALDVDLEAPDVVSGQFVQRIDIMLGTPPDKDGEFGGVKFAG